MRIEIDADLSGMRDLMGRDAVDRAQKLLTQRVADDFKLHAPAGGFVPRRTGYLQDTVEVSGKDEVTWPMEYASAVYEGHEKEGGGRVAGNPWFENGKAAQADDWSEYVGGILSEGVNGR